MNSDPASPQSGGQLFNLSPCERDPVFRPLLHTRRATELPTALAFLVWYLGGNFLFAWIGGRALPTPGVDLPFVNDRTAWILYGILVPGGAYFAVRFYRQVGDTFERLYRDGVSRAPQSDYNRFLTRLHRTYNAAWVHSAGLALAAIVFGGMLYGNQVDGEVSWVDLDTGPASVFHVVFGLAAWYCTMVLFIKGVITGRALQQVFDLPVAIQPFHPDGCGGLRLCTDISVTMALFTGFAALAVVLFLGGGVPLFSFPVLIVVVLVALAPAVFGASLYSAHRVMRERRLALLKNVNVVADRRYRSVAAALESGELPGPAGEELQRLADLHDLATRHPVWPTNTQVVAQVTLSVAFPLALLLLQVLLDRVAPGK